MIPLHRPAPLVPASRPLPLALEAPTEMLTETIPPRPTPPVTLPPPADETRVPATVNGTVLEAWQFPAWGVNVTFQVPSNDPGLTTRARLAASAVLGAAIATRTAAANAQRSAREGLKSVKRAIERTDIGIFFPADGWTNSLNLYVEHYRSAVHLHGSSLPIPSHSAISPTFIARLIKGCRG